MVWLLSMSAAPKVVRSSASLTWKMRRATPARSSCGTQLLSALALPQQRSQRLPAGAAACTARSDGRGARRRGRRACWEHLEVDDAVAVAVDLAEQEAALAKAGAQRVKAQQQAVEAGGLGPGGLRALLRRRPRAVQLLG